MEPVGFLPGDIVFCRGRNWLSRAIRWAETAPGEGATWTNHVAGFVSSTEVVEALWRVVRKPWLRMGGGDKQVWRCDSLSMAERAVVAGIAEQYVGRRYGWWKLGVHLVDALFTRLLGREVFFVRRVLRWERYPICSWVWAFAYAQVGISFGCGAECADPDVMHDFVRSDPRWRRVR